MNFFKSILSDDPDPNPDPSSPDQQSHEAPADVEPDHNEKPNSGSDAGVGEIWSFGGLIKTLTTRSESVLETYRKDLQEFGSGLKKETELFREVASKAVKDLPNSIDVIDGVIKSTAEIISQGKDTLLLAPSSSDDVAAAAAVESDTLDANRIFNSGQYSRFESQLVSIQNDQNTFCSEPEDFEEYRKWKLGFDLKEKSEEVEDLIVKNETLGGLYKRVVPNEVDEETFWCRYFYRVYKLKQQESVRAKLVKRAISVDEDDEELSWDVDDDDDETEQVSDVKSKVDEQGKEGCVNVVKRLASDENELGTKDLNDVAKEVSLNKSEPSKEDSTNVVKEAASIVKGASRKDESQTLSSAAVDKKEENKSNADSADKIDPVEAKGNSNDSKKEDTESTPMGKKEEGVVIGSEGKSDKDTCGKDSDVSVVSSQKTGADEDDLDWAEIEDIEGNDDKKATSRVASSDRADLRKRLSVEDDDEDLSWDIEDDDEPVKA